mgnify:CR=1 FL=1
MKPETKFQNRVLKDLKKLDNLWVLKTQEKTRKGVPDLLICANGKFVAIELKNLHCFRVACYKGEYEEKSRAKKKQSHTVR